MPVVLHMVPSANCVDRLPQIRRRLSLAANALGFLKKHSRSFWFNAMTVRLEDTRACLNFQVRSTSRLVSRHFDDFLRPVGLRAAQFNVLAVLAQKGPSLLTDLANMLGIERSGFARNLKPLTRRGLVVLSDGEDRRTRVIEITRAGRQRLREALPKWNRAQTELRTKLGEDRTALLVRVLSGVRKALRG